MPPRPISRSSSYWPASASARRLKSSDCAERAVVTVYTLSTKGGIAQVFTCSRCPPRISDSETRSEHGHADSTDRNGDARHVSDQRNRLRRVLRRQREAGVALLSERVRLSVRRLSRSRDGRARSRQLPARSEQDPPRPHDAARPRRRG